MIGVNAAHAVLGFVVAGGLGILLLAWRDRERIDLDNRLLALVSMCAGLLFGVGWQIVAFVIDWVLYTDLEPSNLDTMTNMQWNDVGAVVAGSLVAWVYCHALGYPTRERLGNAAHWLFDGPSRLLDRHGFLMTIVVGLVIVAAVGALWFAGRPVPGFPIG